MKKILLVDESPATLSALTIEIKRHMSNTEILAASTYREANNIIRHNQNQISAAIINTELPDCEEGQGVMLTSSHNIASIVLSKNENNVLKHLMTKKNILDHISTTNPNFIAYAVDFVKKVLRNYKESVLLVDDSKLFRDAFKNDLHKLQFNVIEAIDGREAFDIMASPQGESISVVLTDYNMPNMDGIELTMRLRERFQKDTLAIIAISATEDVDALTQFIKAGANDFISKPHQFEELNVRINANLDVLELFKEAKNLANRDFLTGAYNRRYFFEASNAIVNKNYRKNTPIAVATIDIDNFKNINDTYGHDIGDIAIKEVVTVLHKSLRKSDLVARFGGEEFCILLEDISLENTLTLFDKLRKNFKFNDIELKDIIVNYTVSIGISYGRSDDIDKMLKVSDDALYEAKSRGKDTVILHQIEGE